MTSSIEFSSDSSPVRQNKNRNTGRRVNWGDTTIRNSMDETVTLGASLGIGVGNGRLSALMTHHQYSIVVGLQITNFTNYDLIDPCTTAFYGFCPQPAVPVVAGSKEILIARKNGYTLSGTNGVASWLIKGMKKRVFILWDVPYFFSNRMAVGFTKRGEEKFSENWCRDIKDCKLHNRLVYQIGTYHQSYEELKVTDNENTFTVQGTMGGGSKPQINVEVRPEYETDLAPNLLQDSIIYRE